jgi:hypothetical protein
MKLIYCGPFFLGGGDHRQKKLGGLQIKGKTMKDLNFKLEFLIRHAQVSPQARSGFNR